LNDELARALLVFSPVDNVLWGMYGTDVSTLESPDDSTVVPLLTYVFTGCHRIQVPSATHVRSPAAPDVPHLFCHIDFIICWHARRLDPVTSRRPCPCTLLAPRYCGRGASVCTCYRVIVTESKLLRRWTIDKQVSTRSRFMSDCIDV